MNGSTAESVAKRGASWNKNDVNNKGIGLRGCFERQGVTSVPTAFAELYPTTFTQFVTRFVASLFRFSVLCAVATHTLYYLSCEIAASQPDHSPLDASQPQGTPIAASLRFAPHDTLLGLPAHGVLLGAAVCLAHTVAFVLGHGFYTICDKTGLFSQYRLSRTAATAPSAALVSRASMSQLIALLTLQPAMAIVAGGYLFNANQGGVCAATNFWENVLLFGLALLVNETGFYTVHRLLHMPFLYRTIHKKHHEFIGSMSFAAEYSHPLEDLVAAVLPTVGIFLVPFLPPLTPLFGFVWILARSFETFEAHSGYCFHGTLLQRLGLLHSSHQAFHDFHHTINKGNFGTSLLWDYLLGTDSLYVSKLASGGL